MYLNLVQIAESFGVPESVVEDWIRLEGLPHTPNRGVLLFDRAQVAQWAATRGLAAKAGFLGEGAPALTSKMCLAPLLRIGGIWRDVAPVDVPETYVRVAQRLPGVTAAVSRLLAQRLREPAGVNLAPIGRGYAVPHPAARISLGRNSGALALILLCDPLPSVQHQVDEEPVRRLFFFIAPSPRVHLDMLGRLSRLIARGALSGVLDGKGTDEEILQAVSAADNGASEPAQGGRAARA